MDQEQASEALNPSTSISGKKLNAKAPEFVPRSGSSAAAPPPPPPPLLQPVYARPPSFVPPLPPPYYGYENYYQQNVTPFYGYNVSPVGPVEFVADGKNGSSTTTATAKNGLSDSHQKVINQTLLPTSSYVSYLLLNPQVEFYFSDINLATTDQLFRFMSKDPEGYVPLSVVASFKKIKTAITDSTQLASILQSSNKLLVSEDGKKVKRKHPLTESDMEELQSRIVIAENLPEDHSHQNLMKIFSSVGSVKSIRTCPPQNSNGGGSSASKSGKGDGLNISGKLEENKTKSNVQRKMRNNVGGGGKGKGRGHQPRGRPHHPTNGGNVLGYPPLEVSGNTEKMNIAKGSSVPRMPDGTKGFSVGRGKSVAV
ncbi:hypothetical protein DH2020_049466 [Rehmannia glutinosa]|uniref:HTH La-type RNA-binding domain-containing protein n=1 Tax=Rehmannia glutinosa TaxID=99300 RepID=A0ABR0U3H2_REHGL